MTPKPDHRVISDTTDNGPSRREILTAGLAVAGAGLAPVQSATGPRGMIGIAAAGSTAVEFQARLAQTGPAGEHFIAYGFLTRVEGAADDDLFLGSTHNETTALLTAYASGDLTRRIFDGSIHSLDVEGTLTVYQRDAPGANFADPNSFQIGTPVATFAITLQDVLTVFAPGKGLPTLNGDMQQTAADKLADRGRTFGRVGARARLLATGLGTLVDPVTLNSNLQMAGNWASK